MREVREKSRTSLASDILSMRVVLDTGVLVAAMRSESGASRRVLAAGLKRRFRMLVSVPLLMEYEAVLKRPQHLRVAGLGLREVDRLLDAVAGVSEPVRLSFLWRPQLRDVGDEMLLETVANGRADVLVTFDRRELRGAVRSFGAKVLLPSEFLEELKTDEAE